MRNFSYYIHKNERSNYQEQFQYYPHYRNAITSYVASNVEFSNLGSHITPNRNKPVTTLFSRNYDAALNVNLQGRFYKLGIAFEPLGLNHFIDKPFSEIAPERVNLFTGFGNDYQDLVKKLLKSENSPVTELDTFLLSQKKEFSNQRLQSVLDILFERGCELSVQTLAENEEVSRKTVLRDFQKDLACSVKTYQSLIRFRQALNNYQQADKKTSFTELALQHSYYDQPAFIKNFKQITGFNPRHFFEKLKQYGNADTFWSTD
ncbi:helix-turn-helix transcriptional regulator [Cryomorpha ignava]|uniref:Helix-turn-helix transcriptional regulator n=1 Tax=Cryomorpha ignava TaxID=101383 RepID=A0A7K3WUD6_9FLAO|nr:helix-turn-helix domain-containing protein [Cryomorpha ignava]NEN25114.1 helix-turn-helix transcriptional regulator [Cryomorpha ignava]